MTSAFDQRIIKATIQFEDGAVTFEGLAIRAVGRKYQSAQFNECQCTIYNMSEAQRNYILTKTSPLKLLERTVPLTLEVGRESYGTFVLFDGTITRSNTTQPPDIGVTLISLTSAFQARVTQGYTQAALVTVRQISQAVADSLGLNLVFQATSGDKQVGNLSHNGSASSQVQQLNNIGGIIAFIDNKNLIVLDSNKGREGDARLINSATGMIGIPELTEQGVRVGVMIDNTIELGGKVRIESKINPVANGDYTVKQILFEVANRDQPFYYYLDCRADTLYGGYIG